MYIHFDFVFDAVRPFLLVGDRVKLERMRGASE